MRLVPTSDDLTVAVHDQGGAGPPTLLCHATGLHAAVWEPLGAGLGEHRHRWALDFRAHGASAVPPGLDLHWRGMADDVLAVVDGLGLPEGTVLGVGHSMGGAALLLAEQARPGTFAGLWLYEPIAPPPVAAEALQGGNRLAEGAARRRPSFASRQAALENYASKPPLNVARADALHAYVRHGFVDGPDGVVHLACRPVDESRIFGGGTTHGAYQRLDEVACPVVVAIGGEPAGPALFAPAVADALPRGILVRHAHLTHFGPLEAPTELAHGIARFAESL
jgi:pimeloyl-ACP methyl ester carboxylesterase